MDIPTAAKRTVRFSRSVRVRMGYCFNCVGGGGFVPAVGAGFVVAVGGAGATGPGVVAPTAAGPTAALSGGALDLRSLTMPFGLSISGAAGANGGGSSPGAGFHWAAIRKLIRCRSGRSE